MELIMEDKADVVVLEDEERDAMMSRHMVNGRIASCNKITCIVPNSKVGTPIFQL